ncbi:hypothetical protein Q8A67_024902 [Cirrhinus molitorella]|uniref:Uncharacterized protein n=1 Tax=Cirrhinus molitorella TaxID=172907 RepID=A0AA88P2S6_9TELE|nr:hypothetical protein Q8A67_024902 [Cirrhinus molitorella]
MKANNIFSIQSNQAYKFLEISPSSLSKEDWEKEYNNVKEKLEKIRPNTVNHKAITHNSTSSLEFIQDPLPSAGRMALLYHPSYLCLGKFPKLERLIRERAIETQQLFGSSEAFPLKCVYTSENLVKSLLPSLKVTAEKNKPTLAWKWIGDIISDVKEIVTKYHKHNSDAAKSTSDIIAVKDETEKQQQKQTIEMEEIQKIVENLEGKLHRINKKKFWEKVGSLLDKLKKETFTGEVWIDDLAAML